MIPIDWKDVNGQPDFRYRAQLQMDLFKEWWFENTEGKSEILWTLHGSWIRLPGESMEYAVPFSEARPQTGIFWKKVIDVVDPKIDFTDTDVVVFLLPLGQKVIPEGAQELYPIGSIREFPPKEGNLKAFMAPGYRWDQPGITIWSYWAHELGHLSGLSHGGNPRGGGSFNGFDVMYNQDGHTRTFTGWWRFVKGWLSETQILCQEISSLQESIVSLVPLNDKESGLKVTIVRLNENQAVVLESRRVTKFDPINSPEGYERNNIGVLAYLYDGRLGHLQDFFVPIASNQALEEFNWDGKLRFMLKPGDVAVIDKLRVEVLASGTRDLMRISKLSESEAAAPRPTPRPAPSPMTDDFGVEPTMQGGAIRTGESTGESTWYGQNFLSYRIYVVSTSNRNAKPMFDTGIINDYRSPVIPL